MTLNFLKQVEGSRRYNITKSETGISAFLIYDFKWTSFSI